MAVNAVTGHVASCIWYSEQTGKYETLSFPAVLLKLVTASESSAEAQASDAAASRVDEDAGEPAVRVDWSA